jgi:uncharacterized UPF0160 family protein
MMISKHLQRSVGTHDGAFHADEVTACALLLFFDLVDQNKIIRTRANEQLALCEYVCDVGGIYDPEKKRFDHHQSEYKGDLSSAGMVWFYLKEKKYVDEKKYRYFDRALISGVDAIDNGKAPIEENFCSFSQVVTNFVPPHYDAPKAVLEKAFFDALDFVLGHLKRLSVRYEYIFSCREKVAESMKKNEQYLYFDEAMPWMESFFDLGGETHPALFVVMPSGSHWKLRGIPPNLQERMKVRMPLPQTWAGLFEEDLKRISGIDGAIFCHKGRFISVWETKEAVLKALDFILES